MRTDVKIDKKQVQLPYHWRSGYDKYKAQFGDVVFFKEGSRTEIGRVIGRIAEGNDPDFGNLKNYLVVIGVSLRFGGTFERWVKPENVENCYPNDCLELSRKLAIFFADKWLSKPTDELRKSAQDGDFFIKNT